MQRPASVSLLKGTHHMPLQEKPREGTKLRKVYDKLFENAGFPIPIDFNENNITTLTLFYGLDIRSVQRKSFKRNLEKTVVLAGYWDGRVYIDCIAKAHLKTPRSPE